MGRILYIPSKLFRPNCGLLYNWWAATHANNITSSNDWIVPIGEAFKTTLLFVDNDGTRLSNTAGGELKETGYTFWNSPNTGATNAFGFNAKGSGIRSDSGNFSNLKISTGYWSPNSFSENGVATIMNDTAHFYVCWYGQGTLSFNKPYGASIRLLKTSTSLSNGQSGKYIGNNGKEYKTICIGSQEWLAGNLAETKFRTGDLIPFAGSNGINFTNAEWAALTTAGCCAYNNDITLI